MLSDSRKYNPRKAYGLDYVLFVRGHSSFKGSYGYAILYLSGKRKGLVSCAHLVFMVDAVMLIQTLGTGNLFEGEIAENEDHCRIITRREYQCAYAEDPGIIDFSEFALG